MILLDDPKTASIPVVMVTATYRRERGRPVARDAHLVAAPEDEADGVEDLAGGERLRDVVLGAALIAGEREMTLVLAVVVVLTYVWIVKSRGEDAPWMLWVFLTAVAALVVRLLPHR